MLTHLHPSPQWFTPESVSPRPSGPPCPVPARQPSAQSPFAHVRRYLPWRGVSHHVGGHYPSLLLRTHPPVLNPPPASGFPLGQLVFAGCCQPLLGVGPSRRYLCESFSACLDPYPGCPWGAFARFFSQDIGLPRVRTGSALRSLRADDFSRTGSLSRLQSFASLQARRFARHSGRPYHSPRPVGSPASPFSPCFQACASLAEPWTWF